MAVSLFLSLSITATYFYVDSLYGYGIDGDNINNVVYLDVSARAYTFFYYNGLTSKSVSGHVALNSLPREKQI